MAFVPVLVALIALSVAYFIYVNQNVDRGDCSNDYKLLISDMKRESYLKNFSCEGECFFRDTYKQASELFVNSALLAGADVSEMQVSGLTTDVAVFEGRKDSYIVHISGTHGPEGHAGSAVQSAALQYFIVNNVYNETSKSSLPTLILVHALNPHGFHTGRRVNEDNIDLNRNFLSDDEFAFVRGRDPNYAQYEDLDHVLNPTTKPFNNTILNEIHSVYKLVFNAASYGTTKIKRAMVSGNYHKQSGYGFGGFERSASANNLIDLLVKKHRLHEKAKHLVLIDVHTGLGPSGVDTLLTLDSAKAALTSSSPEVVDVDYASIFPVEVDETGRVVGGILGVEGARKKVSSGKEKGAATGAAVASGYELTVGTVSGTFCNSMLAPNLSGADKICLSQEFGTVNMLVVGKYGVDENYAFHYGTTEEKAYYLDKFRSCFYVQTREWKRRVVHRGTKLIFQAFEHLGASI